MLFLSTALALALVPAADAAPAAPLAPPAAEARPRGSLDGVVTNGTLTLAGQLFYRQFCLAWYDKPLNEMFAVAVRERSSARRGNQVVVEHAGRVVFQGALPLGAARIRQASLQAVDIAYDSAANAEVQRLLFRQDELAPDEI